MCPLIRYGLALYMACGVLVAWADDSSGGYLDGVTIPCPGASSEVAFAKCTRAALERADRELNAVYQQLSAAADRESAAHLRNMQRAWIQLRDAQCGLVLYYHRDAAQPWRWKTHCEAVMTIRRVTELKQLGTGIRWRAE